MLTSIKTAHSKASVCVKAFSVADGLANCLEVVIVCPNHTPLYCRECRMQSTNGWKDQISATCFCFWVLSTDKKTKPQFLPHMFFFFNLGSWNLNVDLVLRISEFHKIQLSIKVMAAVDTMHGCLEVWRYPLKHSFCMTLCFLELLSER